MSNFFLAKSARLWRGKRNARKRGAVLVEMVMMAGLALVICTVTGRALITAWTMGKLTNTKAALQTQTRRVMSLLQDDIQSSSYALPSSNGFSASPTTLILQAPSYDSAFQQIAGSNDVIIYRLVGNSAPYTLNRQVIPASGSARPAVPNTVMVRNVDSARFSYLYDQKSTSTGLPLVTLLLVNLSATPTITSALGLPPPTVLVNGELTNANLSLSSSLLLFSPAPPINASIDIFFPVDPSVTVNQANVTAVFATVSASVTDASLKNAATQTMTVSGGGELRNH